VLWKILNVDQFLNKPETGRGVCDRMVVGFITTNAIKDYHH